MKIVKNITTKLTQKFPRFYYLIRSYFYLSKHLYMLALVTIPILLTSFYYFNLLKPKLISSSKETSNDMFNALLTTHPFSINKAAEFYIDFSFGCALIVFSTILGYRFFNKLYVSKNITLVRDGTWKSDIKFITLLCIVTGFLNFGILSFGIDGLLFLIISRFFIYLNVFYFLLRKEVFGHALCAKPNEHTLTT